MIFSILKGRVLDIMSPWTEFETPVNRRIELFRNRLWTLT